MTPGERVKVVRKELGLTLVEFGNRIGLKNNSVSQIENNKNALTEKTLKSICREFNVSIAWLKEGKGDMFTDLPETILDQLVEEYHLDDFDKELIKKYLDLTDSEREVIKKYIKSLSLK